MGRLHQIWEREVLGRIVDRAMRDTFDLRAELLSGVSGRVAEIGFGTGANLRAYGAGVEEIVAIDPAHGLLERAAEPIRRSGHKVTVVAASASRPLPLDPASFDAVVITFVLCSVKRVPEMLEQARRLLRPGAPLLVAEHVVAEDRRTLRLQRAIKPVWSFLLGGCDPAFDARAALEAAGFDTRGLHAVTLPFPNPVKLGLAGRAFVR